MNISGKWTDVIILAAITCQVPVKSESAVFTLYDRNNHTLDADRLAGQFVPEFTRIERQCAEGYLHSDGSNASTSHCGNESVWYPLLRPCHRK